MAAEDSSTTVVQLAEFDLPGMKCRIVDQKTVRGYYCQTVFDETDRNRFFLYTDNTRLVFANFSEEKLWFFGFKFWIAWKRCKIALFFCG
jgi:hypothetical protein